MLRYGQLSQFINLKFNSSCYDKNNQVYVAMCMVLNDKLVAIAYTNVAKQWICSSIKYKHFLKSDMHFAADAEYMHGYSWLDINNSLE